MKKHSAGFHRLRRAYFAEKNGKKVKSPVEQMQPVQQMVRDQQNLMMDVLETEVRPVFIDKRQKRWEKDAKKAVHEDRKRIFIEHILAMARRRKADDEGAR